MKKIKESSILNILKLLNFKNVNGIFEKKYPDCKIKVNIEKEKICYPTNLMKVHDKTTSNFSATENLVVLECVDRLLSIGYPADKIELEKRWQVGKAHGGKLDILVRSQNSDEIYLMIECKTYSKEYEKEIKNMLCNKGQIFTYYQQERSAKFLCLYTSYNKKNEIYYEYSAVTIEENFKNLMSKDELFERWNKQFIHKGVFEEDTIPYNVGNKPLILNDLKRLNKDDGQRIFHHFLEILRHNTVSDKGNAFNKIFNLFLCKICDEESKKKSEKLDFQWIEGSDDEKKIMDRLNRLYKVGMEKFLNKKITDYNLDDLNIEDDNLIEIFTELRLYKNQEFAFIDVYNEKSFMENTKIVIEVVKLLQSWQIKYTNKQQFLGEFFELLLNTGFKQESGQFFTPVPLVRFMLFSLPIKEIIQKKIDNRERNFLPYLIDFACGSGHFLTESMDIYQTILSQLKSDTVTTGQSNTINAYLEDEYTWAKEYIYGVELDYRLVKTAKLSSFLNGDGEARIIHGSGIDPFSSDDYQEKLREINQFDILVANPPYAVKGFKGTVKDGENSFSLFSDISDRSDQIEILFVERMSQLLVPGGVAGIILPRSFLGGSEYKKARNLMFQQFELKSIVLLGDATFMATQIKTVIIFLIKRTKTLKINNVKEFQKICKNQEFTLVDCGKDKKDQKRILGYEFSGRKGSEGIINKGNSLLFNEEFLESPKYFNYYIKNSFSGGHIENIDKKIANNIYSLKLADVIDWELTEEEKKNNVIPNAIVYLPPKKLISTSNDNLKPIKSVLSIIKSGNRPKKGVSDFTEGAWSLGGEHIDESLGSVVTEKMKFVPVEYYDNMDSKCHVMDEDILVCKDGAKTGKCAWFVSNNKTSSKVAVNEHVFRIRTDPSLCRQRYMYYFMMSKYFKEQVEIHAYQKKGQAGLGLKHFDKIQYLNLSLSEQDKIIKQIDSKWEKLQGKNKRNNYVNDVFAKLGLEFEIIDVSSYKK